MPDSASGPGKTRPRFGEKNKFLPVAFVWCIIIGLYLIYTILHCAPLLRNSKNQASAVVQTTIFHVVTALLAFCYIACMLVHPGVIPDDSPEETIPPDQSLTKEEVCLMYFERKRSGLQRHCKWCGKNKPDRCHHCRVCRMCILKMDHHCQYIYNCVGFRNHKYFFLLLFYTTIDCHLIFWTMLSTVHAAVDPTTHFMTMFLLLFGETLAGLFGLVMTLFFNFHIYLMWNAQTTIEYCEAKRTKTKSGPSEYSRSRMGNIRAVLGENPLFWCLPVSMPEGSGTVFTSEDTPIQTYIDNTSSTVQSVEPTQGTSPTLPLGAQLLHTPVGNRIPSYLP